MLRLFSILMLVVTVAGLLGQAGESATIFGNQQIYLRYSYTDQPVARGMADRTWIWGPSPISSSIDESYAESPGGIRLVQYFDKSRMEITYPDDPVDDLWYVTNGLLVIEMATGRMQTGDGLYEERAPAIQNLAGDQTGDPRSPTYGTVAQLMDKPARPAGEPIIERVTRDGAVFVDDRFAAAGVQGAILVPETSHVVAEPFWEFMNSTGLVSDGATTFEGALFPNPFYATGLPIIEAYWTTIPVGGVETDVLFQCFERRCLTYTPGNDPGWQVEAGNVGRHYYEWRYGASPTLETFLFLIALDDGGTIGEPIGCNDSLVEINRAVDTSRGPVVGTLEALLAIDEPFFGESGYYTALSDWDVQVDAVALDSGLARVELSGEIAIGGACDVPRIEAQLERSVLQFEDVATVEILVNGVPLEEVLSGE